jgi:hypothetical protein
MNLAAASLTQTIRPDTRPPLNVVKQLNDHPTRTLLCLSLLFMGLTANSLHTEDKLFPLFGFLTVASIGSLMSTITNPQQCRLERFPPPTHLI